MPPEHILYGSRGSGSAAVELALQRCQLPHRIVRASTWEPDSALEELRHVNPLQQIPTLVLPDGTVMSESAAILIHLGLAHRESGLLPAAESERAKALRGLVYIAANCYSAIGIIDYPERWTVATDKAAHDQLRAGARARLHMHWEVFADMFDATPFLSGSQPGALDFLAAVVSRWAGTRAHLQEHRPRFFATLQRIEAQPEVAAVFAKHWDA